MVWSGSWNNCLVTERLLFMFTAKNFEQAVTSAALNKVVNEASIYLYIGSRPTTSDCSRYVTMTGFAVDNCQT